MPLGFLMKEVQKSRLVKGKIINDLLIDQSETIIQDELTFKMKELYHESFNQFFALSIKCSSKNSDLDCSIGSGLNIPKYNTDSNNLNNDLKQSEISIYSAYFQLGNLFDELSIEYNSSIDRLEDNFMEEYARIEDTLLGVYLILENKSKNEHKMVTTDLSSWVIISWVSFTLYFLYIIFGGIGMVYFVDKSLLKIHILSDLIPRINKQELTFFLRRYKKIKAHLPTSLTSDEQRVFIEDKDFNLQYQIMKYKVINRSKTSQTKISKKRQKSIINKKRTKNLKIEVNSNRTRLMFLIVVSISLIFYSAPLILEVYVLHLQNQSINSLITEVFISEQISANLFCYFSIFYSQSNQILKPTASNLKFKLFEEQLLNHIQRSIDQRNIFIEDIAHYEEIKKVLDSNLCENINYQEKKLFNQAQTYQRKSDDRVVLTTYSKENCKILLKKLGIDNFIVTLNDFSYSYKDNIDNMQKTKSKIVFESPKFIYRDKLSYYAALKSDTLADLFRELFIKEMEI